MKASDFKTYIKFLSRNKLYTLVSIVGFAISLMFVIQLSIYVKQESSVDNFHEKKDRIYLATHDYQVQFPTSVGPFLKEKIPEVEDFIRIYTHYLPTYVGEKGKDRTEAKSLFADSTFFTVFNFKLIEGDPSKVLSVRKSVVITQGFARKLFEDANPIGLTLTLDDIEYNITGIMEDIPQNSQMPQSDLVVNYYSIADYCGGDQVFTADHNSGFAVYILAKEGVDFLPKTPMILDLFKEKYWLYSKGFADDLKFIPLADVYFTIKGNGTIRVNSKTLITVYTVIAILILVVAILNYVNMTVAQSGFRGKEVAIKKILGSNRRHIISQLLYESLLMTIIAFALGLLLAFACEPLFNDMLGTKLGLAQKFTVPTICFSLLLILSIAFVAGIIPALVISNFNPLEVVKGGLMKKIKSNYSKGLIIFQYTVAITLLICTYFIKQQTDFLMNHDMGYNRDHILVLSNYLEKKQIEGLKSKLLSIPGVELVSVTHGTPMNGGNNMSFEVEGQPVSFQEFAVDSAFLKMYNIRIEPNGVTPTKDTYWVNQQGYNTLNPDPVTHVADMGWIGKKQIAGIVSDFNMGSLHSPLGLVRMKMDPDHWSFKDISVKIADGADLFGTARLVEKAYTEYSGGEVAEAKFIDEMVQDWYQREKNTSSILTTFTLLTIIVTIMGVLAMSLYLVGQKEKEIGIRKVNGATETEILLMLNKDSLKSVLIAFVVASPIAYYAVHKWLESFPYKIDIGIAAFLFAGCSVVLLTIISVSWMTWRAAHANPVESLKGD